MFHRVLWWGDAVKPTGFSRVTHGVLDHLDVRHLQVDVLGVNYDGLPQPQVRRYRIHAVPDRHIDPHGFAYLELFIAATQATRVVLFNDPWVVAKALQIDESGRSALMAKFPTTRFIGWMPVDSTGYEGLGWGDVLNNLHTVVTYSRFGAEQLKAGGLEKEPIIIGHGVDGRVFSPLSQSERIAARREARIDLDDFVVFNGNRNQPRKAIPETIEGFARFARRMIDRLEVMACLLGAPVLYLHMDPEDEAGWPLEPLIARACEQYGLNPIRHFRVSRGFEWVSDERLRLLYGMSDVGLNTSQGEGFGLVPVEQTFCGDIPQVFTNAGAAPEIFAGHFVPIPPSGEVTGLKVITRGALVAPDDVADALWRVYTTPTWAATLAQAARKHLGGDAFQWPVIAQMWRSLLLG